SGDRSATRFVRVREGTRRVWRRIRRPPVSYAAAALLAAVGIWGAVGALGVMGIGPAASLIESGALPARPSIVVGDVKSMDVDSAFGSAVSYLLRGSLGDSRTLRPVITEARPSKTPRELAVAAGAHAIIE